MQETSQVGRCVDRARYARVDSLRVATGRKVTMGHILVKTQHIFIKFGDYIRYVKIVVHVEIGLICVIVAMVTAIYVSMEVCLQSKIILGM